MKDTKKGMNYGGMVPMPKAMPNAPMKALPKSAPKSKASPMPKASPMRKRVNMDNVTKVYGGMAAGGMAKKGK